MPMGLRNAPTTFIWTMDNLFIDMLDKGMIVFLDGELIYSTLVEKHFKLLEKVFAYLHKYEFHF